MKILKVKSIGCASPGLVALTASDPAQPSLPSLPSSSSYSFFIPFVTLAITSFLPYACILTNASLQSPPPRHLHWNLLLPSTSVSLLACLPPKYVCIYALLTFLLLLCRSLFLHSASSSSAVNRISQFPSKPALSFLFILLVC